MLLQQHPQKRDDILTCEDINDFTDIKFVLSVLINKFVGLSSKHLWFFLESLRQSSEIFGNLREFSEILGKCLGMFVWPSEQFWKIFGNLWKVVGNLWKIIKNTIISTLHVSLETWILRSRGKNNIPLVCSLVRYCSCHSNIKFKSSRHCVISSM